ncbi:hypothetical protein GGQ89_003709 [Sphingomonas yabuuchiae]|uniref:Uncharacterized protein n=1 Tax=Sphingomonas yabuuchiae TaxID=172044 RepID=A0ABR6KEQ4_9SPHN|nr:hypothetical protein [Sphingomonas yabuuchiae]
MEQNVTRTHTDPDLSLCVGSMLGRSRRAETEGRHF